MFIHMTIMHMMQVTIMQVVDVIIMDNRCVAAARTVCVRVVWVSGALALVGHGSFLAS